MKLKFKIQPYQTNAVESVVDCFAGQVNISKNTYRINPGKKPTTIEQTGFKNADIQLSDTQLLENIQAVQRRQNLPLSDKLVHYADCKLNFYIEMETGTGKTYCYIKTIFELNKCYGWTKFIIVVPSIAIREGVLKSLDITAEHFMKSYSKKARFFVYNSKQLHHLESFSSDAGINIMVINMQAFNATGKDNRRIYDELDDFQSRRPIDVISNNRPILILDEPQKMEGSKTLEALAKFNPLMMLHYSATHRTKHKKIYRLDALDAYNQQLVKKIAVCGIDTKGLPGTNPYLCLESIDISTRAPVARIEMEVRQNNGIKRVVKRFGKGKNLFIVSNNLEQYRGFVITQIDAKNDIVEFTNGHVLSVGEATGDITEIAIRRIQIRETIKAHFQKEQQLFAQGIKVLSLFFIDEVAKYRDYSRKDEQGEYARIFAEEYEKIKDEYLNELTPDDKIYQKYLTNIPLRHTHNGYFSIDKKTKRLTDPNTKTRGESAGLSDDVDAYDLILRDKERLLSFSEPVRFIFSHSALREGWDNPNVFVMCMLKHSNNTISRRQEIGRGLRLSVNQHGDRMDNPAIVHDINVLTVVTSESYKDFVTNLQREISDTLLDRPQKANEEYFTGKVIMTNTGPLEILPIMAKQINRYLVRNDYTDLTDQIVENYHKAKANGTLATLPPELASYSDQIFKLIDNVFSQDQLPNIPNSRKLKINYRNTNFQKKEFQALWNRINRKAIYRVEFESSELIQNCIQALNKELRVELLTYTIQKGEQIKNANYEQLKTGHGFKISETSTQYGTSAHSIIPYDLLKEIAENTQLTRKTIASILIGIQPDVFNQFKQSPEHFIAEVSRLIKEQKATIIIERLSYDSTAETYDASIFTTQQSIQDFNKASEKLRNHIYDYAITDSNVEKEFVEELDTNTAVAVYAKLPRGFQIPTPVGDYNPDWAISFKEGTVKYIYFIAETKYSLSTMTFRGIEGKKIECARKFFDEINRKINSKYVKYDVVTSYRQLMEIVGLKETTA